VSFTALVSLQDGDLVKDFVISSSLNFMSRSLCTAAEASLSLSSGSRQGYANGFIAASTL
ncbi:hypothetical protein Bpfe_010736, partial [Biomphalaria pfeifferi]